ncbi:MAG: uracil-DNA glycosylase [Methylobacterium frigidaeris]
MTTDAAHDRSLLSLLDFHVEAGVDAALDEAPRDRFAESAAPRPRPVPPEAAVAPAPPERPAAPPAAPAPGPGTFGRSAEAAPGEALEDARALARTAASLEDLEALLARFESCALRFTAKNLVFADGAPGARVMFVGEAPGAEEDRAGKPFMGRSGQLLDRMMRAIGLDRTNAYVGNVVPWRPPGNRNPTPQEIATCKPFIERQITLADPDILVCLGGVATQALAGTRDGILKSRGRWYPYRTDRREIRLLATLHPAYLLRQPLQKRLAWRDFRALKAALDQPAP